MITDEQLAEWEAKANSATDGPWEWRNSDDLRTLAGREEYQYGAAVLVLGTTIDGAAELDMSDDDREFLVSARTAVPALVAEVRRHRSRITQLIREREALREVADASRVALDKIADGACRPPRGSYGSGCSGRCEGIAQVALDDLAKLDEVRP